MGAWILSACVNIIYASELCIGVGFDTVTAEGIEAAASDGTLCKFGPASTLNAIATISYGVCSILLCLYVSIKLFILRNEAKDSKTSLNGFTPKQLTQSFFRKLQHPPA
jgi:hypothetical protein